MRRQWLGRDRYAQWWRGCEERSGRTRPRLDRRGWHRLRDGPSASRWPGSGDPFVESAILMFRRRDRPLAAPELLRARDRFREVAGLVDEAKATLLLGVPSGRVARLPLAEALAVFEEGLKRAGGAMGGWRAPEGEPEWEGCPAAVGEAALPAQRVR